MDLIDFYHILASYRLFKLQIAPLVYDLLIDNSASECDSFFKRITEERHFKIITEEEYIKANLSSEEKQMMPLPAIIGE